MRRRKPDRFKHFLQVIPIFLLLLLSGCGSHSNRTWQHPDKQGELQLLKDWKECRELAQTEVAQINYFYNFYGGGMYELPYYGPYYRGDRYQDDVERFFRVCMKAKGWQRVKIIGIASNE